MTTKLVIRGADMRGAPGLSTPLNSSLGALDTRLQSLEGQSQQFVIGPIDIVFGPLGVAPQIPPFPICVGLPQGVTIQGMQVINVINLTEAGVYSDEAIVVNGWHQEGGFLYVDFITGLSGDTKYRLTFGGFRVF